jgi:transposase
MRAKAVLLAGDGKSTVDIARKLGLSTDFVSIWRNRFAFAGIAGLTDRPRSGRPIKFEPAQRLEMVATACEPGPAIDGLNGWTLNLIRDAVRSRGVANVSRSRLHVILQRAELHPHKKRIWLHSPDPKFREKVDDIVGLYIDPPPNSTVVCVDEKPGMQALERKHPDKPATPALGDSCLLPESPITGPVASPCSPQVTSSPCFDEKALEAALPDVDDSLAVQAATAPVSDTAAMEPTKALDSSEICVNVTADKSASQPASALADYKSKLSAQLAGVWMTSIFDAYVPSAEAVAATPKDPSPPTVPNVAVSNALVADASDRLEGFTAQGLASIFREALSAQANQQPSPRETSAETREAQPAELHAVGQAADHTDPTTKSTKQVRKPCKRCKNCKCGRQGQPGKREFEYIRHGTLTLIGAFIVATGQVFGHIGPTRTGNDLEAFMEYLATQIDGTIHIIWDNLNIHHGQRWRDFNARHDNRFHFHYTPLHASWVNQIEIWFGIFHRRCLKNGSFTGLDDLRRQVEAFLAIWNEKDKHPFKWSFGGYGTIKVEATELDRSSAHVPIQQPKRRRSKSPKTNPGT